MPCAYTRSTVLGNLQAAVYARIIKYENSPPTLPETAAAAAPLVRGMLTRDPPQRLTATAALSLEWFGECVVEEKAELSHLGPRPEAQQGSNSGVGQSAQDRSLDWLAAATERAGMAQLDEQRALEATSDDEDRLWAKAEFEEVLERAEALWHRSHERWESTFAMFGTHL